MKLTIPSRISQLSLYLTLSWGLLIISPASTRAADLRMRFIYDGDPPPVQPLAINKDVDFCGQCNLVDESLLVNPKNHGIANVVVYLYAGRRGTDLKTIAVPPPVPNRRLDVSIKNCRYRNRVSIARVGDTLVWNSGDGVLHNSNFLFLKHPALGFLLRVNEVATRQLTEPEPAPIPVRCNIHPWERSYLLVLDHPFAAVSDENGLLEIKGLPKDKPLVFRAFHERLTFKAGVVVNGQPTTWKLNRFEKMLVADHDDVITIKVPPPMEPSEQAADGN